MLQKCQYFGILTRSQKVTERLYLERLYLYGMGKQVVGHFPNDEVLALRQEIVKR